MKIKIISVLCGLLCATSESAWAELTSPTNLTATPTSSSTIQLTWIYNSTDVIDGFKIFRGRNAATMTLVRVIDNPQVENYLDSGLASSTTYSYVVKAYKNKTTSRKSNVAAATTTLVQTEASPATSTPTPIPSLGVPSPTPSPSASPSPSPSASPSAQPSPSPSASARSSPSASPSAQPSPSASPLDTTPPTDNPGRVDPSVVVISISQINVSWASNAFTDTSPITYELRLSSSTGILLSTTSPFADMGLSAGTQRCYVLVAIDARNNRASTAPTCATTFSPPVAPTNLAVTSTTSNSVSLSFSDNSNNESSFDLMRTRMSDNFVTHITVPAHAGVGTTPFTDSGLNPGTLYRYQIASQTNSPNLTSAYSASTTTTTQALPSPTPTPSPSATPSPSPSPSAQPSPSASPSAQPSQSASPSPSPVTSNSSEWARNLGGNSADSGKSVAIDSNQNIVITGTFTSTADIGGTSLTTAGSSDIFIAKFNSAGQSLWPAKRIGGIGLDTAYSLAIDSSSGCDGGTDTNCIIITGTFGYTVDFNPSATAVYELATAGAGDIFVAKYTSTGNFLWARRAGSNHTSYPDYSYGVAVDASNVCKGCVVITGSFYERADFVGITQAVTLSGPAGVMTPYAVKYSSAGEIIWAKTFANTNEGWGQVVAVDKDGNIAIAGRFKGSMNFGNGTKSSFGNDDGYIAKLNPDGTGTNSWSYRFGSGGQEQVFGINFDKQGNVAITGSFTSTSGGVTFGGGTWSANGTDLFIAKFNTDGTHLWSRRCTGTYTMTRRGSGVASDDEGNTYLTGHFYGSLNCGIGTPTINGIGYADILAAKFNSAGQVDWMRNWGKVGAADNGTSIAVNHEGNQIVVTGVIQSSLEISGQTLPARGSDDAFLARLAP